LRILASFAPPASSFSEETRKACNRCSWKESANDDKNSRRLYPFRASTDAVQEGDPRYARSLVPTAMVIRTDRFDAFLSGWFGSATNRPTAR
jgi:hypothetical protein